MNTSEILSELSESLGLDFTEQDIAHDYEQESILLPSNAELDEELPEYPAMNI